MASADSSLQQEIHTLYCDHHSWLQGWLRRKLGDAGKAADLAHDTFVRLLAREEPIAAREPRAYLTTIAQRLLINHVKRQSLEQSYLDVLAQMPEAEALSPEARLIILETLHEIDAMLDGLGVKAREAFLLSQLEGLTYAQIAAKLGVTDRTVKRYMAAAFEQCILLVSPD